MNALTTLPRSSSGEATAAASRMRLRQPVEVGHRQPVLLAEPADRLGIQRLARRADAPEGLRIARARVLDRHHRAHRSRGREDVRHAVATEEVELLVRVEAALAPVHTLHRAQTPGAEQRRDPRGPRPLAHAVEALAVGDLVAVDEL